MKNTAFNPATRTPIKTKLGGTLYACKKGESSCPGGKPKGSRSFNSLLKEVGEWDIPLKYKEKLRKAFPNLPKHTTVNMAEAVTLHNAALDREDWAFKHLHSMPKQEVDITSDGQSVNSPVFSVISEKSTELIKNLLDGKAP